MKSPALSPKEGFSCGTFSIALTVLKIPLPSRFFLSRFFRHGRVWFGSSTKPNKLGTQTKEIAHRIRAREGRAGTMDKQGEMGWIRATGLVLIIGFGMVFILIGIGLDKITKKGAFAMKR